MAFLLIDILPLKTGKTQQEGMDYFEGLRHVFERHGLRRQDKPLFAQKVLRGALVADLVNLFETENPEASMKGLSADAEYQAMIPTRDQLFDLERSNVVLTARA